MKIDTNIQAIALQNKMELMKLQASSDIKSNPIINTQAVSFSDTMNNMVNGINQQQLAAGAKMAAVDAGRSDDLVGAMVMSQKAGLSFSVLMQVRNKLMSGFDDIMRMPL
ncbi:flagellar hook-basal body complex protein FliE [Thalassotalea sp. PLHSN55]|uniref:flagellar hook-basal body complex protein FliE n=1 Tax=Thalassotalea sp. PLHSN55 TaxID=3435888 RepID=UPI003F846EF8